MVVETFMCGVFLLSTIPPSLAIYPSVDSIKTEEIEDEFKNLKDREGNHIDRFYFYKGL